MQHIITISIDEELLEQVDEELKTSIFNGRSPLVSYLLNRYLHQRRFSKYKDIIYFGIILTCLLLLIVLQLVR